MRSEKGASDRGTEYSLADQTHFFNPTGNDNMVATVRGSLY